MAELGETCNFAVSGQRHVSGLWLMPPAACACYVFAHGAGAGMTHPFMQASAAALADRGIATLRYQFPYMEAHTKRPDPPAVCHATVRAAVNEATRLSAGLPLFAGGRSFGGRMTSQACAQAALPNVLGLIFLAFPLHPAGRPADDRAAHLAKITLPMLFLQGTRDELADLTLLQALVDRLGSQVTLQLIEGGDHSFRVPARSGRTVQAIIVELVQGMSNWIAPLLPSQPPS